MQIDSDQQNQQQNPNQEQKGGQPNSPYTPQSSSPNFVKTTKGRQADEELNYSPSLARRRLRGGSYKINWKKFGLFLGGLVVLAVLVVGGFWLFKSFNQKNPVKLFDVAVNLQDQTANNPETEKIKLKTGDVVLVRESGKDWSEKEKAEYLIIKMRIKESQAEDLVEPNAEKFSEKEAVKKGIASKEDLDNLSKEQRERFLSWSIGARKYRISFEKLEFDPEKIGEGQPFMDREFGWEIVEKK